MIVDTNRMGRFLAEPPDSDARPVHEWIRRKGRLVFTTGGKFGLELGDDARKQLAGYARRGMAKRVDHDELRNDEGQLVEAGKLRSDDAHVLALAWASGARLLYTGDRDLIEDFIEDFKNPGIIRNPRGKVYSGVKNRKLLNQLACPE